MESNDTATGRLTLKAMLVILAIFSVAFAIWIRPVNREIYIDPGPGMPPATGEWNGDYQIRSVDEVR